MWSLLGLGPYTDRLTQGQIRCVIQLSATVQSLRFHHLVATELRSVASGFAFGERVPN